MSSISLYNSSSFSYMSSSLGRQGECFDATIGFVGPGSGEMVLSIYSGSDSIGSVPEHFL